MTGAPTWPVVARVSEEWLHQALAAVDSAADHRLSRREREIATWVSLGGGRN